MPKKGRRKRPGKHTVHTKDPRYNVKNYPRGKGDLVTRHGVTKTQHAWNVDDGMVASPVYAHPTDEWRGDHNRSDVVDVDYHPSEASPEVAKAQLKKYREWLERYYSIGMRDPENPSKTLPPEHPLTKLYTERIKTEIKYYEGKLTTPQYQRKIELLEQKEKVIKKRLSSKKSKSKKATTEKKPKVKQEGREAIDHEGFMVVRKLDGKWVNLFPRHQGDLPERHKTKSKAEEYAKRLEKNMNLTTKVLPASEALKLEIPPRSADKAPDPQKRSFKSAGKALEKGWELSSHRPMDLKSIKANEREVEKRGLMTLIVPSRSQTGKYVVYARKHPEKKPPETGFSEIMWNNEKWVWDWKKEDWTRDTHRPRPDKRMKE